MQRKNQMPVCFLLCTCVQHLQRSSSVSVLQPIFVGPVIVHPLRTDDCFRSITYVIDHELSSIQSPDSNLGFIQTNPQLSSH